MKEQAVEVLRLGRDRNVPAGYFRQGEILVSATFPGLELRTADLFA